MKHELHVFQEFSVGCVLRFYVNEFYTHGLHCIHQTLLRAEISL